jgi:hypothetical protein
LPKAFAKTVTFSLLIQESLTINCDSVLKYGDAEDQKYTKLRLSNPKVQEHIILVPGAIDLMLAIGFTITEIESPEGIIEDYLYFTNSASSPTALNLAIQISTNLLDRLGAQ